MIEFVERVGVEPKVFPGVDLAITEDKPKDEAEDKKKQHKKDDDGDASFDQAPELEENGADEEDVQY